MFVEFDINERDRGFLIEGYLAGAIDERLAEAVRDVADKLEEEAILNAPENKDYAAYTWRPRPSVPLKENPVDRFSWEKETPRRYIPPRAGGITTGIYQYARGGGPSSTFSIRGAGGRFVKGKGDLPGERIIGSPGRYTSANMVAYEEVTVTEAVPYAIFVHEGTTPYTAHGDYMIYTSALCKARTPRRYKVAMVQGQNSNPYLQFAYNAVEPSYTRLRVAQLKRELGLIT